MDTIRLAKTFKGLNCPALCFVGCVTAGTRMADANVPITAISRYSGSRGHPNDDSLCCVPQIMEAQILDSRFPEGSLESVLDVCNRLPRTSVAKYVFTIVVSHLPQNILYDGIQRVGSRFVL